MVLWILRVKIFC